MRDGISYRMWYLNGRLRAYEREEDLKNLVERSIKTDKTRKLRKTSEQDPQTLSTPDGKKIIL